MKILDQVRGIEATAPMRQASAYGYLQWNSAWVLLETAADIMRDQRGLQENHAGGNTDGIMRTFLDLGSGIGRVTAQAAYWNTVTKALGKDPIIEGPTS